MQFSCRSLALKFCRGVSCLFNCFVVLEFLTVFVAILLLLHVLKYLVQQLNIYNYIFSNTTVFAFIVALLLFTSKQRSKYVSVSIYFIYYEFSPQSIPIPIQSHLAFVVYPQQLSICICLHKSSNSESAAFNDDVIANTIGLIRSKNVWKDFYIFIIASLADYFARKAFTLLLVAKASKLLRILVIVSIFSF